MSNTNEKALNEKAVNNSEYGSTAVKATLADRLKALAAEVSGTSPLTTGRNKVDTNAIVSYPELTLRDFDFISYVDKTTGEQIKYPVLIFDEIPDGFYCGGMALSDLCNAIKDDPELYEELKTAGLKMSFSATKTKSNNTYVNFTVL
jgi:hypothetical protein